MYTLGRLGRHIYQVIPPWEARVGRYIPPCTHREAREGGIYHCLYTPRRLGRVAYTTVVHTWEAMGGIYHCFTLFWEAREALFHCFTLFWEAIEASRDPKEALRTLGG